MIVEALVRVVLVIIGFLVELIPAMLPPFEVPEGFAESAGQLGEWLGEANQVIPIDFAVACLSLVLSALIFSATLKVVRILLSLFTGGGGSAA